MAGEPDDGIGVLLEITGGTGVFEDITGEGDITGEFTCLPSREATCAQLGVLSDAVFSLQGTFSGPTAG